MNIALAQLNYHIGNFEHNTEKIIKAIKEAKANGADLVVFAELCICGYPPLDFLEMDDFIQKCEEAVQAIAAECVGISAIVGSPTRNTKVEGKDLYNSALLLKDGKIDQVTHKALLPNYDVFDEYRYFEPYRDLKKIHFKGLDIALTVCEDLWDIEENLLYTISPLDEICKSTVDLVINIAASPFDYKHADQRKRVLKTNAQKFDLPIIYVNHVGAQTELIFDGGSLVVNKSGEVIRELKYFSEHIDYIKLEQINSTTPASYKETSKEERIYNALVLGIKDYFKKSNFSKAVLGLSGGIDSALTMVLACEALGKENVLGVMLPSRFSSQHSIDDSVLLGKNLGCEVIKVPIEDTFAAALQTLEPVFQNRKFDVAEENMQARIRGLLLMGISNKLGYILLNTSNKSEAAVGYGTLYGDMCGGLSVIGDVYKTEVYALCRYINRDQEIIPENILVKPPSAELRPDQKDSDSLPEYDVLDRILYQYIELKQGPKNIIAQGFDPLTVNKALKLVNNNEYKRKQTPPILRISPKAFGLGRRMPIVGKYLG